MARTPLSAAWSCFANCAEDTLYVLPVRLEETKWSVIEVVGSEVLNLFDFLGKPF